MSDESGKINRATRHTLIREVLVGPPETMIRATETMDVEIIWPADRSGWMSGGGDWRVLNPPPIGYSVDHANEPSMEALKQDEISREYEREGSEEWAGKAGQANDDAIVERENRRQFEMETERHA